MPMPTPTPMPTHSRFCTWAYRILLVVALLLFLLVGWLRHANATVASTTTSVSYSGDDNTTVFAYTFKIFQSDDLEVWFYDSDTELETEQTTGFTVSGVGVATGGNVTFSTAPSSTTTILLRRITERTQETDLIPNARISAATLEDQYDKLAMMVQENDEALDRTAKFRNSSTSTNPLLPEPLDGAFLYWDGADLDNSDQGLTTSMRGYLGGLELARADATTITVSTGVCRDSTNATTILLSSAMTKALTNTWAAGDGGNGLDTGSVSTSDWYHVFVIKKDSDGTGDVLLSASLTPTMPTGYTYYRRVGSIYNDSGGDIDDFTQFGDWFYWATAVKDVDVSNQGASSITYTLSVPTEVNVAAILQTAHYNAVAVSKLNIRSLSTADAAVNAATAPLATVSSEAAGTAGFGFAIVTTNTSAQVAARADAPNCETAIATIGWIDRRGRDD